MHGQYIRTIDKKLISKDTFLWLSKGEPKAETESEIMAAQDQATHKKYNAKMLNIETDSKCRLCSQFYETTDSTYAPQCILLTK